MTRGSLLFGNIAGSFYDCCGNFVVVTGAIIKKGEKRGEGEEEEKGEKAF
jgi:hypothetical protein